MGAYRLTIRHGSSVKGERYTALDEAVAAMEDRVRDIRRAGPLRQVSAFRDYEPGQRVHARLELSTAYAKLVDELPGLRLGCGYDEVPFSLHPVIRSIASLPLEFDAR